MTSNYIHSDLTGMIIKAFYTVYNRLGYGFLEKVYENALLIELRKMKLTCSAQCPVKVFYDEIQVGYYMADIIVNNDIIIEIKAAENLADQHEAQLTNYLRATDIEVGVLFNFGKKPQFKRKVFSAEYKNHKIS